MTTYFECQFAPNAATPRDLICVAQIVSQDGETAYEAFAPQAFEGWGAKPIAVLVDHDVKKRAGTVQRHRGPRRLVARDVRAGWPLRGPSRPVH